MGDTIYVAWVNQYYVKLYHEETELLKAISHFVYMPDDLKVYENPDKIVISQIPFAHIYENLLIITSKKFFALYVYYLKKVGFRKWRITKKVVIHPEPRDEEETLRHLKEFKYKETNDYSYIKFKGE